MTKLARTVATPIWVLLVLATLVSWWIGAVDVDLGEHSLATVTVVVVAFVKAALVGLFFMELRHAPLALRLPFLAWCALFCGVVVGFYLV